MFFQSNLDSVGVQNRIGIIYFLLIALHFTAAMPSITATPLERTLIKRERSAASYSAYSAFISKWICGLPSLLGSSMFLVVPLYFIVGLNTSDARFWKFVFVIIAHVMTSNAFGMFMGASMPTVTLAMIYGPLCMTVFMMFGGLTVDLDHVPEVFRW
jgi:ABC-type multidrug transport system permease subunit